MSTKWFVCPNLGQRKKEIEDPAPVTQYQKVRQEPGVPDETRIPSWRHLLTGLWLSGLRLGEALELHWTDRQKIRVDLSMKHPMFRIPADAEKGNRDRILPMTPDFADFLLSTSKNKRKGFVFNPLPLLATHGKTGKPPARMQPNAVGKMIGCIGKAANVVGNRKDPRQERRTAGKYRFLQVLTIFVGPLVSDGPNV